MNIAIDKNLCIGCGACASLCPQSFKLNEGEDIAEVISRDDKDCAQKAATSCPAQAISVS